MNDRDTTGQPPSGDDSGAADESRRPWNAAGDDGSPPGTREPTDRQRRGGGVRTEPTEAANRGRREENGDKFQEVKTRVHRDLLERIDLSNLSLRTRENAIDETRRVIQHLLSRETTPLNEGERTELTEQILHEVFGYGPLEPLLRDPSVSDILVNTHDRVYVERDGKLERTDVVFRDEDHLRQVIDRIVSAVGRRIDDSSPMVDARLPDGSRVNAIVPPLAVDGPHLSIRKFRTDVLSAQDLLANATVTEPMLEFLQGCVKARLNILISGGTGSGKTTLLNVLSESIPVNERVVTVEDSAELQLRQPHVVRLETRPPSVEGTGQVGQRQLVINALRMRPDRIIVGEVRGAEAVDMLQAMNTGHDGSLTTLHANTPRDALARLETMTSMANLNLPEQAMRQQTASAIDLLIQVTRLSDGRRKISQITEVVGMEGDVISLQDLFLFKRTGVSQDGTVEGEFEATGIRPKSADRLEAYGVDLGATLFANSEYGYAGRNG